MSEELAAADTPRSSSEGQHNSTAIERGSDGIRKKKRSSSASQKNGVPQGKFLSPRTSGIEAGSSYIARSGFPLLATSEEFVKSIEAKIDDLLNDFKRKWAIEVEKYDRHGEEVGADLPMNTLSLFSVFKNLYKGHGWHLHQLYWSEHQRTRRNIYHAYIRALTDKLRPLLSLLSISNGSTVKGDSVAVKDAPGSILIRSSGILFMLRLIQGSTALVPSDVDSSNLSCRIPIEADLYHALILLPDMIKQTSILPSRTIQDAPQPIDEIVYVIRRLIGKGEELGMTANDTSTPMSAEAKGVFDLLLPTICDAREAAINNCRSSLAQTERRSGQWGTLKSSKGKSVTVPLGKADAAYNLLRQRLNLPLHASSADIGDRQETRGADFVMETGRGKRSAAMAWPDEGAIAAVTDRIKEVEDRKIAYQSGKRDAIGPYDFLALLPSQDDAARTNQPNDDSQASNARGCRLDEMLLSAQRSVAESLEKSLKDADAS